MHDAVLVRIGQCARDLAQHAHRVTHRQFAMAREPHAQRLALHERHREVRQPLGLARRVQRHDVRMLQPRGEQDLALEAFERHLRRGLGREDLDHDLAAEGGLFGHEHARHATAAEFALDGVAAAQGRLELVAQVGRGQWGSGGVDTLC